MSATGPLDHPIVLVEWADAHQNDPGWLDLEEIEDDGECIIRTVGFLVPADEPGGKAGHVTVMQSFNQGDVIGLFHIPVAMARTVRVVTPND